MSTSSSADPTLGEAPVPSGPVPTQPPASAPTSGPTSGPTSTPAWAGGPATGIGDLGSEISRLANALFSQWHLPPSVDLRAPGSPGVTPFGAPTFPGLPQPPSVWSSPFAKESDLRGIPVNAEERAPLPFSLPLSLVDEPVSPYGGTHYFLDLAGHPPAARQGAAPVAAAPVATPRRTDGESVADPDVASAVSGVSAPRGAPPGRGSSSGLFDPHAIRRDFPILQERIKGRPLVWLDNAATTQKPQAVIDRLAYFYAHENSNVHRAAHTLAARATDAYEAARNTVRRFLNAPSPKEIVFVRGATEAINLVAQSWGRRHVQAGDEIVITWLEHHANIVPWQMLATEKGARMRVAPVDDRGQVDLEAYEKLLGPRTRIVSISQVSNALGTIVPVAEMTAMAHRHGARVLIDGAQAVSHLRVDVQALDCDFYCFSGHKVFAPTGIGALFGKQELLETMPPWQGGGNMIADVTFEKTVYNPPPGRFEAGTGNIADAVGLGAALDYVSALGLENIGRYEHELLEYGTARLAEVPGLHFIGTAAEKAGVLSFVLDGVRTEEVGGLLDQEGIAVRSGHHCAQPILRRFGVESTVRASLAPYNTCEDLDALVAALKRIQVGRPSH